MLSSAFFQKRDLWKHGPDVEMWPELEAALESFEGYHVVNAETRRLQAKISILIDRNTAADDRDGRGILHGLACEINCLGAERTILQDLLQLGARPDLLAGDGWDKWTPSHMLAYFAADDNYSIKVAEALVACRPDLGLKGDIDGNTPAEVARERGKSGIAQIFEDAERNGFPTIAQLAQERKWWAVHNLCRRDVVPDPEKFAPYNGKDAIQWAVHHKEFAIAEELEFLFKGVVQPKNEGLEDKLVASKAGLKKRDEQKEALEQKVDEQGEQLKQLKADLAAMKTEGEQLKEMLLVNLARVNEVHQKPKKDLATTKENHSKRKKDLQEERDGQFEQLKRMKINSTADTSSLQDKGKSGQGAGVDGRTTAGSKAAEGDEAEKVALQAENKALKEQVGHLSEVLKAQAAQLDSFLKGDS